MSVTSFLYAFVVETESTVQGHRKSRTFTNGFLHQTRLQITSLRTRPTKRERPRGSFKARNLRTGCLLVLSCGFTENVRSSVLLLLKKDNILFAY